MPRRAAPPAATPTVRAPRGGDRHSRLRRSITFGGQMWRDLQAAARAMRLQGGVSELIRLVLRAWLYAEPMPVPPWAAGMGMGRPPVAPAPVPPRIAPPPLPEPPKVAPTPVFWAERPEPATVPWKVTVDREGAAA